MFCHDVHFNEPWPSAEICRAAIEESVQRQQCAAPVLSAETDAVRASMTVSAGLAVKGYNRLINRLGYRGL